MTDYLANLSGPELAKLNPVRSGGKHRNVWPDDANIRHMKLGSHLGPDDRDRIAMVFEALEGQYHSALSLASSRRDAVAVRAMVEARVGTDRAV